MTLGLHFRGPVALAAYYLLFCHDPLTYLVRLLVRFKMVRKSMLRGLIPYNHPYFPHHSFRYVSLHAWRFCISGRV